MRTKKMLKEASRADRLGGRPRFPLGGRAIHHTNALGVVVARGIRENA